MLLKVDLMVYGKVPLLYFDTSQNFSQEYLSKSLWLSTFSLKKSKSLQHSKKNLFELCLSGFISINLLYTETSHIATV